MDVNTQPLVSILIPFGDLYSMSGILVRLAAFRLVEAGMETKPGIESQFYLQVLMETRTDHEPHRSYSCATVSKQDWDGSCRCVTKCCVGNILDLLSRPRKHFIRS
jgi:hypothetical protein